MTALPRQMPGAVVSLADCAETMGGAAPALVLSRDGLVVTANPAATLWFGHGHGGLDGLGLDALIAGRQGSVLAEWLRMAQGGEGQGSEGQGGRLVRLRSHPGQKTTGWRLMPVGLGDRVVAFLLSAAQAEPLPPAPAEPPAIYPWFVDRQSGRIWGSAAYVALFGRNGVTDLAVVRARIHPEDRAPGAAIMAEIAAGQRSRFEIALRLRGAHGGWRWFLSRGAALAGAPGLICGSLTDIDAPRKGEELLASALREMARARNAAADRDDLLRMLADAGRIAHFSFLPEPVAGQTPGGSAPDETYRLFGHEPGGFACDIAGLAGMIHPDDAPDSLRIIRTALAGAEGEFRCEHRLRHKDGSYHWYRSVGRRFDRSARGLPPIVTGAHIDIDDLKASDHRATDLASAAREAHDEMEAVAQNSPGALFELRQDPDGRQHFPFFTRQMAHLLGIAPERLRADAEAFFDHVPPEDAARIRAGFLRSQAGLTRVSTRHRLAHPTRGPMTLMISANPVARPDGGIAWYGKLFDLTAELELERRTAEAQAAVAAAHDQLTTMSNLVQVGLFEWRRQPGGRSDFVYANDHLCDIIGVPRERLEVLRNGFVDLLPFEDRPAHLARREESAAAGTPWRIRFRLLHPQRGLVWITGSAVPRQDRQGATIWTGAIHDATNDVQREEALQRAHRISEAMRAENERLALHDGLTGLPNRRYHDRYVKELQEGLSRDPGAGTALIRLDLDQFKQINDTHGHEAGDAALRHMAAVLRSAIRTGDFAARIGGDEFSLVLASDSRREDVMGIAERIRSRMAEVFDWQGHPIRLSASFGIAFAADLTEPGDDPQTCADAALYRAKEGGRNRVEVFAGEAARQIRAAWDMSAALRAGLERDEFLPYFQPQVSAHTGEVVGFEVLMRWRHPTRGILAPGQFLQAAEQLRIVPEIDRIMMEKTHLLLEGWRRQGMVLPRISFNVSSSHLHDPAVIDLARKLAQGATKVAFELIESILVEEESPTFRRHLDEIRRLGVEIEIDDFGTGHASMLGLIAIAPHVLKIDRRFVAPIVEEERARKMVRMIVDLAGSLNIRTVAEGVETEEQAVLLAQMGCDVFQGYLFSRPLAGGDLEGWLRLRSAGVQGGGWGDHAADPVFPLTLERKAASPV